MSDPRSVSGPTTRPDGSPLPPVDTLWFDVSALLLLPPGYVAGIPRTVCKVFRAWRDQPWTNVRFCAVVPNVGLAEVDPDCLTADGTPKRAATGAAAGADAGGPRRRPGRPQSRYWYLPWGVRHLVRTAQKKSESFMAGPVEGADAAAAGPRHFPPYGDNVSLRLLPDLGPRDLVLSLGGMWMVPDVSKTIERARGRLGFHFVSLIYDLIPLFAPHYSSPALIHKSFTPCTLTQIKESDVVLTISDFSRQDIVRYAKQEMLPVGPVEVFTLGSDISPVDGEAAGPRPHSRPFVLTVGSVEVRKNHYGMYQAWRKLVKAHGPDAVPDLVVAGKPGWQGDEILYLMRNDPLVRDKIIVKAAPSDRELDWLYRNCLFTLYPSMYEGWGLPVEESFIYGKMCVTTTASSLPEVGREFAEYVEPDDADAIAAAVKRGLDEEYRREREAFIRERFRPNTWAQSSQQLQRILRSHYRLPRLGGGAGPSRLRRAGRKARQLVASLFSFLA